MNALFISCRPVCESQMLVLGKNYLPAAPGSSGAPVPRNGNVLSCGSPVCAVQQHCQLQQALLLPCRGSCRTGASRCSSTSSRRSSINSPLLADHLAHT